MSNSSDCGAIGDQLGDEFCGFMYGITGSLVFMICYGCIRGCTNVRDNITLTIKSTFEDLERRLPKTICSDSEEYDSMCVVCIENIAENDYICKLPCGHYFHPDCIYQWLNEQNICPLCKSVAIEGV